MSDARRSTDRIVAEEDWDALGALVDTSFFSLLLTDPEPLTRALCAAPERWLAENPRYLHARDMALMNSAPQRLIGDRTRKGFVDWVRKDPSPETRDVLGVQQGDIRFLLAVGRIADASELADESLHTLRNAPDFSGYLDVTPVVLIRVGIAKLLAGEVAASIGAFTDAHHLARATIGGHPAGRHAQDHRALALALTGNARAAQRHLRLGLDGRGEPVGSLVQHYELAGVLAHLLIALRRMDRRGADEAASFLDEQVDSTDFWWVAAHANARYALLWGDREESAALLQDLLTARRSHTGPGTMANIVLRTDLANLYQALGRLSEAASVLSSSDQVSSTYGPMLASRARLELLRGFPERALRGLSSLSGMEDMGAERHVDALAVHAAAEHALCDEQRAQIARRRVARVILRTDSFSTVAEAAPAIRAELAAAVGLSGGLLGIFTDYRIVQLTARERDILHAMREYPSTKSIASALHISQNTVKTHMNSLYRKLDVHSRDQALRVAGRVAPLRDPSAEGIVLR